MRRIATSSQLLSPCSPSLDPAWGPPKEALTLNPKRLVLRLQGPQSASGFRELHTLGSGFLRLLLNMLTVFLTRTPATAQAEGIDWTTSEQNDHESGGL